MNASTPSIRPARLAAALAAAMVALLPQTAFAQDVKPPVGGTIEADGTVVVPSFRLPPSLYLSDAGKKALPRKPTDLEGMMRMIPQDKIGGMRLQMPQLMAPVLTQLKSIYKVTVRDATIAGVRAAYATPAAGVPKANAGKILLNLPGGGFVMGVASGTGMVESIPLAGLMGVEIVSITYRQGPETTFPAASEDVVKVYRELLKTHKPQDIAIFGCSAGGLLTAEAMPALIKAALPLPAAIGIFCASADARWGGDSSTFSRPFQALPSRGGHPDYFNNIDLNDPMASPILSPETLKRFPPTLIISSTRAHDLSGAVTTHRELVKAGATTELHVWDGLGHAFFYDPALPESREAFDVMAKFFRTYLKMR